MILRKKTGVLDSVILLLGYGALVVIVGIPSPRPEQVANLPGFHTTVIKILGAKLLRGKMNC